MSCDSSEGESRRSQKGDRVGEGSKAGGAARGIDRRTLLRTATAAAVGGVGASAATGSAAAGDLVSGECDEASAPSDFSRVSTRDHYDGDANLINGESAWSYDVEGSWDKWGDDLALFIHGWQNSDEDNDDIDGGYETQLALEQEGWSGETAVYTWDSDKGGGVDQGWGESKEIAEKNGRKLANFTQWYSNTYGADVRWIAHSLGARVVLFGLESLEDDYGEYNGVKSVSLLGGAVEEDDVSTNAGWWDSEWGDHIEYAAETCDNYYDDGDEVLEWIYESWEWEDAVGEKGCDGPEPYNYTDHDVSYVPTHYDYNTRGCGCMTAVVDNW